MAVIDLTTPYSLKNATLAIEADDFTAAISQVQFTPSTSTATWRGIGGNVVKDQSKAEWSCTLAFAQDLAPEGLLRYLLDHDGDKKEVVFTPVAAGPTVTATLVMSPGDIGGTAGADLAASSVSLAVDGRPVFADPTP